MLAASPNRGGRLPARNRRRRGRPRRRIRSDLPLGALVSYGHFLLVFLVLPIIVLAFVLRRHLTRQYARALLGLAAIAFAYTTPWDNAIVALGVWGYDPALVWGIVLGWVPLEEYLFFLLQPMLSGLILLALLARSRGTSGA